MTFPEHLECNLCGRETPGDASTCDCGASFNPLRRLSEKALEELDHSEAVVVPKEAVDDPTESGYRRSHLGKRKGQKRDYRMSASEFKGRDEEGREVYADGGEESDEETDSRELHLREYDDRYTLHWDAHPATSPMHAVKDAPDYGAACVALAGVAVTAVASGLRRRRRRVDGE